MAMVQGLDGGPDMAGVYRQSLPLGIMVTASSWPGIIVSDHASASVPQNPSPAPEQTKTVGCCSITVKFMHIQREQLQRLGEEASSFKDLKWHTVVCCYFRPKLPVNCSHVMQVLFNHINNTSDRGD